MARVVYSECSFVARWHLFAETESLGGAKVLAYLFTKNSREYVEKSGRDGNRVAYPSLLCQQ